MSYSELLLRWLLEAAFDKALARFITAAGKDVGGGLEVGECAGLASTCSGDRWAGLLSKRLSSSEVFERLEWIPMVRSVEGCELPWVTVLDGLDEAMSPSLEL